MDRVIDVVGSRLIADGWRARSARAVPPRAIPGGRHRFSRELGGGFLAVVELYNAHAAKGD